MPGERSDASKSHAICTSRALLVVLPPLQVRCVTLSPRGCPRLQQVHSETPTGPQGQGSMDSVLRSVGVSSRELVVTYASSSAYSQSKPMASSCASLTHIDVWLNRCYVSVCFDRRADYIIHGIATNATSAFNRFKSIL